MSKIDCAGLRGPHSRSESFPRSPGWRSCLGSVDTTYERINVVQESTRPADSLPKTVKLGRKNGNGNPQWKEQWTAKSSSGESKMKLKPEGPSSFKSCNVESKKVKAEVSSCFKLRNGEVRKPESGCSSPVESRRPQTPTKVGFIEILSGCRDLLQPSSTYREELFPSIGFLD